VDGYVDSQWRSWKPWNESELSTCERRTSRIGSTSSAPVYSVSARTHANCVVVLTLGVVSLGPVVTGTALAVDKGVRAEEVGEGARADEVHDTGLEVDLDRAGNVLGVGRLVEVDRNCAMLVRAWHDIIVQEAKSERRSRRARLFASLDLNP